MASIVSSCGRVLVVLSLVGGLVGWLVGWLVKWKGGMGGEKSRLAARDEDVRDMTTHRSSLALTTYMGHGVHTSMYVMYVMYAHTYGPIARTPLLLPPRE